VGRLKVRPIRHSWHLASIASESALKATPPSTKVIFKRAKRRSSLVSRAFHTPRWHQRLKALQARLQGGFVLGAAHTGSRRFAHKKMASIICGALH